MIKTELISKAKLPTKYGNFSVYAFTEGEKEHAALVKGDTADKSVNVRIHSKCLTGDTLGSLRCDCGGQLEKSLKFIGNNGGVLIYLDQEGRGIGLTNKIKAYSLQDRGMDTIEANESLGFSGDERNYSIAAEILTILGVSEARLMTNNPTKIEFLENNGVIVHRVPLRTRPNKHNAFYLETKKSRSGHLL